MGMLFGHDAHTLNQKTHPAMKTKIAKFGLFIVLLTCILSAPSRADETLTDKAKEAAKDTSEAVQDAAKATADSAKDFWQRVEGSRLKNRTPDQLMAWAIMGVLAGVIVGSMTALKSTGLGKMGRLLLGLAGAFLGGMIVQVAKVNFGWGVAMIPYEELLFSLIGAIILICIGRVIRSSSKKKVPAE